MPRRKKCKCILYSILAFIIIIVVVASLYDSCSNRDSLRALSILCQKYKKLDVDGSICEDLCTRRSIHFSKCINYRGGKQVYLVKYNNKLFILKSQFAEIEQSPYYSVRNGIQHLPPQDFYDRVNNTIQMNLRLTAKHHKGEDLASNLWQKPFASNGNVTIAALASLWVLIQQDEFLLISYFQSVSSPTKSKDFPHILGSCGHLYIMEYTPMPNAVIPSIRNKLNFFSENWRRRSSIAIGLIKLMISFETNYHQVLHMCDIKIDNFGLSGENVYAIDTDSLLFDTRLRDELTATNCSSDTDCDFFDCKAKCNKGHCIPTRVNNNYQVLCHDIFLSTKTNLYTGLLDSPPAHAKMRLPDLLQKCAYPCQKHITSEDCTRSKTSLGATIELLDYLHENINR